MVEVIASLVPRSVKDEQQPPGSDVEVPQLTLLSQEEWLESLTSSTSVVQVEGYQWHGAALLRHCRYRVVRSWQGKQIGVVYRRFSDFVALHAILTSLHPLRLVPMHPDKVLSSTFFVGEALCAIRTEWCHAFLCALLFGSSGNVILGDPWFRYFLCDASEEWETRLERHAVQWQSQIVSQCKSTVTKFLHLDSSKEDEIVATKEKNEKTNESKNVFKSIVSSISEKIWPANEEPILGEQEAIAWERLRQAHLALCDTKEPLQVFAPPLIDSSSVRQNVSVKVGSDQGRLETFSRATKALVHFDIQVDSQSSALGLCGSGLENLAKTESATEEETLGKLLNEFAGLQRDLEANRCRLHEAIKTKREDRASLQLFLRSSLALAGGHEAFERCVEARQKASALERERREKGIIPVSESLPDYSELISDMNRTNIIVSEEISAAAERIALANIKCAEENQKALQKMLQTLSKSENGINSAYLESNRVRLGLGKSKNLILWDGETPV